MPQKETIRRMFDDIAPGYDALNHIMSLGADRGWRKRAIRKMGCRGKDAVVLDLACGTGDFSLELAGNTGPGAKIYAVDISEGMLDEMRRKVEKEGTGPKIEIITSPAEELPFPDGMFDYVSVAFGIRNFEDREKALRGIHRVLKKGGTLAILELSVPEGRLLRGLYNIYFKNILPLIGKRISGNGPAYSYLPASVAAFPGRKEWIQTMKRCGFDNVVHSAFTFGICRLYLASV